MENKDGLQGPAEISRRDFIKGVGAVGIGAVLAGTVLEMFILPDEVFAFPASEGYLLVDTKKCQGCNSCAMACALAHHGVQNLGLSRIQITQDSFAKWPSDKAVSQCRQCPDAPCVKACPTGANHVDTANGNVRTVDERKCIGCARCVDACQFSTGRALWNFEEKHAEKCDLCTDTPFWTKKDDTPGKACMAVCPTGAIAFTKELPAQTDAGYEVNLRDANWAALGYPTD